MTEQDPPEPTQDPIDDPDWQATGPLPEMVEGNDEEVEGDEDGTAA